MIDKVAFDYWLTRWHLSIDWQGGIWVLMAWIIHVASASRWNVSDEHFAKFSTDKNK